MITHAVVPMPRKRGRVDTRSGRSEPSLHVLTEQTSQRLQQLNAAARRLRTWGITILRQDLAGIWPAVGHPTITIVRRRDQSIAPLLDAVGRVTYIPGAKITALALLDGVRVTWEEPR